MAGSSEQLSPEIESSHDEGNLFECQPTDEHYSPEVWWVHLVREQSWVRRLNPEALQSKNWAENQQMIQKITSEIGKEYQHQQQQKYSV